MPFLFRKKNNCRYKSVIAVDKEERGSTYVIVGRKIKMALTIFITVYPIVNNEQMSYGLDKYTKEQAEAFKLK